MNEIYFIADTHFYHRNSIKYSAVRNCFTDELHMNEVLIDNWNKQVKPNDIVYHLGDFAFTNAENATNLLKSLSGKKIVISGNHDHKLIKNAAFCAELYNLELSYHETKIDNVRAKLISDASASLSAFKNDELDLTLITVEQYPEFKEDKRLTPYDDGSTWYLEYNLKNDFLANKKIRQALTMAIDKEELGSILQAMGKPAYGYVPGFVQGTDKSFRDEAGDTFPHYNPEEAKKLGVTDMIVGKDCDMDDVV